MNVRQRRRTAQHKAHALLFAEARLLGFDMFLYKARDRATIKRLQILITKQRGLNELKTSSHKTP